MKIGDTFKCEHCGEVFEKSWSDEEAEAEAEKIGLGDLAEDDKALVCTDCYNYLLGATIQ